MKRFTSVEPEIAGSSQLLSGRPKVGSCVGVSRSCAADSTQRWETGPNTRFVLTPVAAGGAAGEIASAVIGSGLRPPPVTATAVSPATPLLAPGAAQDGMERTGTCEARRVIAVATAVNAPVRPNQPRFPFSHFPSTRRRPRFRVRAVAGWKGKGRRGSCGLGTDSLRGRHLLH
jgi:hypothetical protein